MIRNITGYLMLTSPDFGEYIVQGPACRVKRQVRRGFFGDNIHIPVAGKPGMPKPFPHQPFDPVPRDGVADPPGNGYAHARPSKFSRQAKYNKIIVLKFFPLAGKFQKFRTIQYSLRFSKAIQGRARPRQNSGFPVFNGNPFVYPQVTPLTVSAPWPDVC